jgi:hypothetical protein
MASRHPAQPNYLTTGAATGHSGTVKPPGTTRKVQADRVIGLPRQKSIEYTTNWVNRASAPWPVGTLPGILACELEAHSVHLISLCVGTLEGHSTYITRRIYRIARKKGSFFDVTSLVLRLPAASSRRGGPGRSGAEPSVPTLAAQTRPPRFVSESPLRGPCSYWPAAAPLVRNSPRGWAPKALPIPEVRAGRADEATALRLLARRHRQTVRVAPVAVVRARQRSGEEGAHRAGMVVPAGQPSRPASAAAPTPTGSPSS